MTEVEAAGERVTVRIVDGWPAYEVVSSTHPAGPPLRTEPPRPEVPARLVLLRTPGGWRIESAQRLT